MAFRSEISKRTELTFKQRDELFVANFNTVIAWANKYSSSKDPELAGTSTAVGVLLGLVSQLNKKINGKNHKFDELIETQLNFIEKHKQTNNVNILSMLSTIDTCLLPIMELNKKIEGKRNDSSAQLEALQKWTKNTKSKVNFYKEGISLVSDVLNCFNHKVIAFRKEEEKNKTYDAAAHFFDAMKDNKEFIFAMATAKERNIIKKNAELSKKTELNDENYNKPSTKAYYPKDKAKKVMKFVKTPLKETFETTVTHVKTPEVSPSQRLRNKYKNLL